MIDVSIVIVCMNNLKNLYPCLNSIRKYTSVSYEVFVVAYLFSKENIERARKDFSWVNFIVSNEIRGFSENNNIALRQSKGKYCFILNDDTEMRMPVVDKLVNAMEQLSNKVSIVSPLIINPDESIQFSGKGPCNWKTLILSLIKLPRYRKMGIKKEPKEGRYKTHNILGAAFLIKREDFEAIGWFDEYYFFTPEDIAVSTKLNELGRECWVDSDVKIVHYEGMTTRSLSMIRCATSPAARKGALVFYAQGSKAIYALLCVVYTVFTLFEILYHWTKFFLKKNREYNRIYLYSDINSLKAVYSKKTPKELFKKYYYMYNKQFGCRRRTEMQ